MLELNAQELAAVDTYFDGDRVFYDNFRASCVLQFAEDIAEGDRACAAQDAPLLRRTAHSLKSVLLTLGHADLSAQAKAVETAANAGPLPEAVAGWQGLRQSLVGTFALVL
jgi:hypothetical protein